MKWQEYENEVFEICQLYFANAVVTKNVKIIGRLLSASRN